MKEKKDVSKIKKKKNRIESVANSGVKKIKHKKIKKIENNTVVADALKEECAGSQKEAGKGIPFRQQTWNKYLKIFAETEKLNKKQKQIMEFCTCKSLTPPKRKQKFLNFIRNCFENQKEVTDEQVNNLFDLILKKYDDFKSGTYTNSDNVESSPVANTSSPGKPSKNKKKKLNLSSNNDKQKNASPVKNDDGEEKFEKPKKRKRKQKVKNVPADVNDVEMDE